MKIINRRARKIKLQLKKEAITIKTDDLFLLFDLLPSQNERFPPVEIGNETVRINRSDPRQIETVHEFPWEYWFNVRSR